MTGDGPPAWRLDDHAVRAIVHSRVSRETGEKLDLFVAELARWQQVKNLVGPDTLRQIWLRHVLDSLQIATAASVEQGLWLDLGSGGGLPGLIVATLRTEAGQGPVRLVESNQGKCAFLLHCIRLLKLDASVDARRIEAVMAAPPDGVRVVSARALAPLSRLLEWTSPLLRNGAMAIFPKGQDVEKEITEASRYWDFEVERLSSETDPAARILRLRMASSDRQSP